MNFDVSLKSFSTTESIDYFQASINFTTAYNFLNAKCTELEQREQPKFDLHERQLKKIESVSYSSFAVVAVTILARFIFKWKKKTLFIAIPLELLAILIMRQFLKSKICDKKAFDLAFSCRNELDSISRAFKKDHHSSELEKWKKIQACWYRIYDKIFSNDENHYSLIMTEEQGTLIKNIMDNTLLDTERLLNNPPKREIFAKGYNDHVKLYSRNLKPISLSSSDQVPVGAPETL